MKPLKLILTLLICLPSCGTLNPQQSGTKPVSHDTFTELLKKYVDEEGLVDYEGFLAERQKLESYLNLLSKNAPNDSNWSENDKIAYWINAYNAFTIDLILDHYPLESIKDIGSMISIPFVNTPWDIKFIDIGGQKLDLNNIEHNILRQQWEEPRIHFAVNCASMSCPQLRREAFEGARLEEQLEESAYSFINDPYRNETTSNIARLSKLFSWYEGDFTKEMSLREFLNQYSEVKIDEDTEIIYKEYDWGINAQN